MKARVILVNSEKQTTDVLTIANGDQVVVTPGESFIVVDEFGNPLEFTSRWIGEELVVNVNDSEDEISFTIQGLQDGNFESESTDSEGSDVITGEVIPDSESEEGDPLTEQSDEVDISFGDSSEAGSGGGVDNLVGGIEMGGGAGNQLMRFSSTAGTGFGNLAGQTAGGVNFGPTSNLGSGGFPPTNPIEQESEPGTGSVSKSTSEPTFVIPPRPALKDLIGGSRDPDESDRTFAPGTTAGDVVVRSLDTENEGIAGQSIFGSKGELVVDAKGNYTYYTDLGGGSGRDIYLVDYPVLDEATGETTIVTETLIFEWSGGNAKWIGPDLSNGIAENFFDDPDNELPDLLTDPNPDDEIESAILVTSINNVDPEEGDVVQAGIGDPVDGAHGFIVVSADGTYDYVMDPDNPLGEDEVETFTLTYIDENGKETVETLTIVGTLQAPTDNDGNPIVGGEPELVLEVLEPVSYEVGEESDPDASDPSIAPEADQDDISVESLNTTDTGEGGELVDGGQGTFVFNGDGSFDYLPDPTAEGPAVDTFLVTYPITDPDDPNSTIEVVETFVFELDADGNVKALEPAASNEPGKTFFSDPDNNDPDLNESIVIESVDNEGGDDSVGVPGVPVKGDNGLLIFNSNGSFDYLTDPDNPLPEGETETFLIKYTDENGETTVESLVFVGESVPATDDEGEVIPGEFKPGVSVYDPTSLLVGGPDDPDGTNPGVDPAAGPGDIIVTSLDTDDSSPAGEIVDGPRGDLIFNEDGTFDYMPEPGATPGIDTFTVEYPPVDGSVPVVETLVFETKADGTVEVLPPTETIEGSFYDDPDNNAPAPESAIVVKSLDTENEDDAGKPVESSNGTLVFNTDGSYDYLADPESPLDEDELDTFTITYTDVEGKVTVETLTFIGDGDGGAGTHQPYSVEIGGEDDPDATNPEIDPAATAEDITVTSLDTEDTGLAGDLIDGPRGDLIFNEDGTFDYIPEPNATPGIDTFTVEYPPEGGDDPVVETLQFETLPDGTVELVSPAETTDGTFYDDPDNNTPNPESSIVVKSIDSGEEDDAGEPVDSSKGTLVFNTNGTYDYLVNPDSPLGEDELDTFTITYTDDGGNVNVETLTFIGNGEGGADTHVPYSVEIGGEGDPDSTNPKVDPGAAPEDIIVTSLDTEDTGEAGELVDGPRGDLIVNEDGTFDYIPEPNAEPGIDTFTVTYPSVDGGDPVTETLTFEMLPDGTVELVVPDQTIDGDFFEDPDNNDPDSESSIIVKSIESNDENPAGTPVNSNNGTLVFNTNGTYDYLADPDNPLAENELDVFTITYTDIEGEVTVETLTFIGDGEGSADIQEPLSLEIGGEEDPDSTDPKVNPAATPADIVVTSLDTGDTGNAGDLIVGDLGDLIFNEDGTYDFIPNPEADPGQDVFTVTYPPLHGGDPVTETLIFEKAPDGTVSQVAPDETIDGNFFEDPDNNTPDPESSIVVKSIESDDEDNAGQPVVSSHGTLVFNEDGTYDYVSNPDNPLAENELDVFTVTYTDEDGKETVETLTFVGDGEGSADLHDPFSAEIGTEIDPDETNRPVDPEATKEEIVVTSLDTDDTGPAGDLVDGPRGDLIFNEDGTFDYVPEPGAEPGIDTFTVEYPVEGQETPVVETLLFETLPDGTVQLVEPADTIEGDFYDDVDNPTPAADTGFVVASVETGDDGDAGEPVTSGHGTLIFNEDGTYDYLLNPETSLSEDETDEFTITYTDEDGNETVETLTFTGDGEGGATEVQPTSSPIEEADDSDNPPVADGTTPDEIKVVSINTGVMGTAGELVNGDLGTLVFNPDGTFDFVLDGAASEGVETFVVTYPSEDGPVTETLTFSHDGEGVVEILDPVSGTIGEEGDPDQTNPTVADGTEPGEFEVLHPVNGEEGEALDPVSGDFGTFVVNPDGTFDYVPDPDAPEGSEDTFVVTFPTDDGPVTETFTFEFPEDGVAVLVEPDSTGDLDLPNESPDIESFFPISVTSEETGESGEPGESVVGGDSDIVFNEDGTFDINVHPDSEAAPGDTEVFAVSYFDPEGEKVTQEIVVEYDGVGGANVVPFATDETNTATEDGPDATGDLVGYDVDTDGSVTFTGGGDGTHGKLTIDNAATGEYSYEVANESAAVQSLAEGETITDTFTYTVEDSDGATVTKDIAITVTGINDDPVGANDVITLNEDAPVSDSGSAVAGSGNGFLANDSDVDSSDTHVISKIEVNGTSYTIPAGGNTSVALGNGNLTVGSDGSYVFDPADGYEFLNIDDEPAVENFTYTIVDDKGGSSVSGVTFEVSGVNDAPVIESNTVAVTEGAYSAITPDDILVTDVDDDPEDITLTVANVEGGSFVDADDNQITEFTMQDIIDGDVGFQHDGSETPAAWDLTATDPGELTDSDAFDSATDPENPFTFVNDAPVIDANSAPVTEGEITVLNATHIHATDPDNSDEELTFSVDFVAGGEFQNSVTGQALSEFTQEDVNDGKVQFAHDGSETVPVWTLTVDDGELEDSSDFNGATDEDNPYAPVNDGPVIENNSAAITEGETTAITLAEISANDPDNADDELAFTVGNVLGGQFEDPNEGGTAITTFTQQDIIDGNVQFVHDGNEIPASWEIEVSDGELTDDSIFNSATDTENPYTAVNDAPVIDANSAPITEGEITVLTESHVHATDPDNTDDELTYSVDFVAGGEFQNSVTGQALSEFTQEDINDGKVQFAHDGSETIPVWTLTVDDGDLEDTSVFNGGTDEDNPYVPVNDGPQIENNSAAITEGGTTAITLAEISANDPDNPDDELTFTVSDVLGGQFEDPDEAGTAITTFTQQDIIDGSVQFVHDGNEIPASWEIEVSDGELTDDSTFDSATDTENPYTPINDGPVIDANSAPITEGEITVLNNSHIHATDPDNDDDELIYSVDFVTGGEFQNSVTGQALSEFSQEDVNDGKVQFAHDGSETASVWTLTVDDGDLDDSSDFNGATDEDNPYVPVNDGPQIENNSAPIIEGEATLITLDEISAIDPDNADDELTFTVSNVLGGQFEDPDNAGTAITTFTQQDIIDGSVQFVHDGNEIPASWEIEVSDGELTDDSVFNSATDTENPYTAVNDAPLIDANSAPITEGQATVLNATHIHATDPDNTDLELVYDVDSVTAGQFQNVATGIPVSSFTQDDVNKGRIQFVHDGSETPAEWTLSVNDGELSDTDSFVSSIDDGTYISVNDPPVATPATNSVTEATDSVAPSVVAGSVLATDAENDELTFTTASVAAFGALTLDDDGTYSYSLDNTNATVNALAVGDQLTETFNVLVSDGEGGSDSTTLTITINGTNDSPVVVADTAAYTENQANAATGNVLANDSDPEGAGLTIASVEGASGSVGNSVAGSFGDFTLNVNGSWTYTENSNIDWVAEDQEVVETFTFVVEDENGGTTTSQIDITVTGINDAPTVASPIPDFVALPAGDEPIIQGPGAPPADSNFSIVDANALTTTQIATSLVGAGVAVQSVSYSGENDQVGTFVNASQGIPGVLGFDDGVVFSTGNVQSIEGANTSDSFSEGPNTSTNDPDLGAVFDLSKMTIDFIPDGSYVIGQYVFGSEEYNEFVGSNFKDNAGIFVNNENVSLTPDGQLLSIATINGGNAARGAAASNPDLYIDNDIDDTGAPYQTQMDGFTKTLTFVAKVNPGEVNTIEIAIGDVLDGGYDSWFLVKAGSLSSIEPVAIDLDVVFDDVDSDDSGNSLTYSIQQEDGSPVPDWITLNGSEIFGIPPLNGEEFDYTLQAIATDQHGNQTIEEFRVASNTTAKDDSASTDEIVPITIDVLDNDFDPENDALTISKINGADISEGETVTVASGATVTLLNDQLVYNPNGQFGALNNGDIFEDVFKYTITDGTNESSSRVVVEINGNSLTPVVIDLDGDGAEFLNVEDGIAFDVDGDGIDEQTAWAGIDDAVLFFDANDNNNVDGRSEVAFSDYSDNPDATDLEGLLYFDTDADNRLDAGDEEFAKFKLWQDADGDGEVGEGELLTLEEAGIESIELISDGISYTAADNDVLVHGEAAVNYSDGSTGIAADAEFNYEDLLISGSEGDSIIAATANGEVIEIESVAEVNAASGAGAEDGIEAGSFSAIEDEEAAAVAAAASA